MIISKEKGGFVYKSFDENGMDNGNMVAIQNRLKQLITPETTYVDLGAHIGTMSIPVIAATKPKKAILVEANPNVIAVLQENCQVNLSGQDFVVVNKAVCDKDEMIDFHVCEKADSSSMAREDLMKIPPTKVQGVTLDTLLADIDEPIVMKVDIEVAELLMWKGMNICRSKIKHMVMEWFPNAMPLGWAAELLQRIHESNYHIMLHSGEVLSDSTIMVFGKEDLWLRSNT